MISCGLLVSCLTDDYKKKGPQLADTEDLRKFDSASFTTIQWLDSVKEMGTMREGDKLEVIYSFKNTGTKPLVIISAKPSCGCTVPSKPEEPIMPGNTAQIKAVFDSRGKSGAQHKKIAIVANTKPSANHSLEFNVEVLGKDSGPTVPTATNPNSF